MTGIPTSKKSRKVLTLKLPAEMRKDQVSRERSRFMVWRENGDSPKRIYDDPVLACQHAAKLCIQEGVPFHVFRTWRIMREPE